MKENIKKKTRGRPSVNVNWPEGKEFTARYVLKETEQSTGRELTPTAIRVKIRKALEAGEIERVGTVSEQAGRPLFTYKKIQKTETKHSW